MQFTGLDKVRVDFDLIFEELKKSFAVVPKGLLRLHLVTRGLECYLKEYRTLGFQVIRQCGKSMWVHKKIISDTTSVLVVSSSTLKKEALNMIGVNNSNRVFTLAEIAGYLKQFDESKPLPWFVGKTVIVDDPSITSKNGLATLVYKWVALSNDPETTILLV